MMDPTLSEDYVKVYAAVLENMPAKRPHHTERIWARLVWQRLMFVGACEADEELKVLADRVRTRLESHYKSPVYLADSPAEQAARSKLKADTARWIKSFNPKE